jgi:hypothetical protein
MSDNENSQDDSVTESENKKLKLEENKEEKDGKLKFKTVK